MSERDVKTCPKCATVHPSGLPAETLGGGLDCLQAQAASLGAHELAEYVGLARTYAHTAQANALGLPMYAADAEDV